MIHLIVGESGGYFTLPLRGWVNIHHYSPPLRRIIVKYCQLLSMCSIVYNVAVLCYVSIENKLGIVLKKKNLYKYCGMF